VILPVLGVAMNIVMLRTVRTVFADAFYWVGVAMPSRMLKKLSGGL
jgi:hypothetical protein